MADSVDRVFVHALNTVKRIRSARPPPADRLKLYGLYKQSMEGDVAGVMERPRGEGEDTRVHQEKWDAWSRQRGLSRTQAKRKYIETLIETMHLYASQTPDARELIAELEFVWDQIKSNPPSSSSSSISNPYPLHIPLLDNSITSDPPPIGYVPGTYPKSPIMDTSIIRADIPTTPIRVLTPISQRDEERQEEDEVEHEPEGLRSPATPGGEVFVDALDSQPDVDEEIQLEDEDGRAEAALSALPANVTNHTAVQRQPPPTPTPLLGPRIQRSDPSNALSTSPSSSSRQPQQPSVYPSPPPSQSHPATLQTTATALIAPLTNYLANKTKRQPPPPIIPTTTTTTTSSHPDSSSATTAAAAATTALTQQKWQRRIETSLIKLTAELAALREQLEFQRLAAAAGGGSSSSAINNPLNLIRRSISMPMASPPASSSSYGYGPYASPWAAVRAAPGRMVVRLLMAWTWWVVRWFVKVLLMNVGVVGVMVGWLRWRHGLSGAQIEEVMVQWVRRGIEGVRWRNGVERRRMEGVTKALKRGVGGSVEGVVRGFEGLVRGAVGGSGVRFLPGTGGGRGMRSGARG